MTDTSTIPDLTLDKFVELNKPQSSYGGRFKDCYYVPTKEEWTSEGEKVLNDEGLYAWYLHEDGKLHMSAFEDDDNEKITSNGYFPSLEAAEQARVDYYTSWGLKDPRTYEKSTVKSEPLFDD